jgi:hypothetical protein
MTYRSLSDVDGWLAMLEELGVLAFLNNDITGMTQLLTTDPVIRSSGHRNAATLLVAVDERHAMSWEDLIQRIRPRNWRMADDIEARVRTSEFGVVSDWNFVMLRNIGWDRIFHDDSGRFWFSLPRECPRPVNVNPGPVFELFKERGLSTDAFLAALKKANVGAFTIAYAHCKKGLSEAGNRAPPVAAVHYHKPERPMRFAGWETTDMDIVSAPVPVNVAVKVGMDYLVSLVNAPGLPAKTIFGMVEKLLSKPEILQRLRKPEFLGKLLEGKTLLDLLRADERLAWVIGPLVTMIQRGLDVYGQDLLKFANPRDALKSGISAIYGSIPVQTLATPWANQEDWHNTLQLAKLTNQALIDLLHDHVKIQEHLWEHLGITELLELVDGADEESGVKIKFLDGLATSLEAEEIESPLFLWHRVPKAFETRAAPQLLGVQNIPHSDSPWYPVLKKLDLLKVPNGLASLAASSCLPEDVPDMAREDQLAVFAAFEVGPRTRIVKECKNLQ